MTPYVLAVLLVLSLLTWNRTRVGSHRESIAVGISIGLSIAMVATVPIEILL